MRALYIADIPLTVTKYIQACDFNGVISPNQNEAVIGYTVKHYWLLILWFHSCMGSMRIVEDGNRLAFDRSSFDGVILTDLKEHLASYAKKS